jgi:hypothetical protein
VEPFGRVERGADHRQPVLVVLHLAAELVEARPLVRDQA